MSGSVFSLSAMDTIHAWVTQTVSVAFSVESGIVENVLCPGMRATFLFASLDVANHDQNEICDARGMVNDGL